jgi:hypothetical protein
MNDDPRWHLGINYLDRLKFSGKYEFLGYVTRSHNKFNYINAPQPRPVWLLILKAQNTASSITHYLFPFLWNDSHLVLHLAMLVFVIPSLLFLVLFLYPAHTLSPLKSRHTP